MVVEPTARIIEGIEAKQFRQEQKWPLLSGYLKEFGQEALAYATLQDGMEYHVLEGVGYLAYTTVRHPVFAPRPHRIVLSDPVCSQEKYGAILDSFLKQRRMATFAVISEGFGEVLRKRGFKVNCVGYEPELPIPTYNTTGDWKDFDLIKRARNEAKREKIQIREERSETLPSEQLRSVSERWISVKKVSDREIWIYARRPVFGAEPDVRKFLAYNGEGEVAGFVFYDPMYRLGRVYGYSANISRCDERRYGRLATAMHMTAMDVFRGEGKEVLNLCLAPFVKLDKGRFNDDKVMRFFFETCARFGNDIYNFEGLSFHKSKYRGVEKPLYFASNRLIPSNDVYLAFLASDITRSYFSTMGRLVGGIAKALFSRGGARHSKQKTVAAEAKKVDPPTRP